MVSKIRSYKFLSQIFSTIPQDVIYSITKYCGKYIHLPKIELNVYKTKTKNNKYHTKHLVMKTRYRAWSV